MLVNLIPSTGPSSKQAKKTKKSPYSSKSAKRRDRMKTGTVPQSSENDILLLHTAVCVPCEVVGIKRKLTLIYHEYCYIVYEYNLPFL